MIFMAKSYCEFMDEISADELYEGLLGYGMFANKLPPIFTSVPFFHFCQAMSPTYSDREWHDYVLYSSMRNINIPRQFGIPTPMKYHRLCVILRDSWDALKAHFHAQTDGQAYKVSRVHIRKMQNRKEIFEMNYKNWRVDGNPETDLLLQKHKKASKYIVRADISTCFPSFYSHSLPWALVGKNEAKDSRNDETLWYNKIDAACFTLKNGETHGLLIGPYASNLLAEVILTKVDKKMYDEGYRYFRNIDDYECYVDSYETAQCFLSCLEEALKEFDLFLNHKKTVIEALPIAVANKWIHKLNSFLANTKEIIEYKEINAYLDLALSLAGYTGDSAVLKYAIKALASQKMTDSAKQLAAQRIMHMAVVFPYLVQMMEDYVFQPYKVDDEQIKVFADALYLDSKVFHNYEGICFAIYYCLKHDVYLNELDKTWVIDRGDCVMLLMTWLYYLKVNKGNRLATDLRPLRRLANSIKKTDMDRYWLFCYEVLSADVLDGDWKDMKRANVSFVCL